MVFACAILCKSRWPEQTELSRKLIHIGIGPIIPLAWWFEIPRNQAIAVAIMFTLAILLNYHFRFLPSVEEVERQSYGTIAYGITITTLLILFWPINSSAVCAGVLVMAFGDGLAGLIGRNIQSPSWRIWRQRKSIAGTTTMFLVSFLILSSLSLIIGVPFYPLRIIAITSLAVAIEQISRWGIDNITVPIAVAFCWAWLISNGIFLTQ